MSFYLVFCSYAKFDNYLNGRHVVARGLTMPHGGREYGLSQDRDNFQKKEIIRRDVFEMVERRGFLIYRSHI